MITSVQSLTRIGDRLPNGAVLIDRKWTRSEERNGEWGSGVAHEAIVLALIARGERREYVTWQYVLDPERGEITVAGHYFNDLLGAVANYQKRVKNLLVHDGPYKPRILT